MQSPAHRQSRVVEISYIGFAGCLLFLPGCVAQDGFCEGRNRENACCEDGGGLVLPLFPGEASWNKNLRAVLYILGLCYCFVGVSVLSDVFMAGIERITNSTYKKKVSVKDSDGNPVLDRKKRPKYEYIDELIWNPTVANLTLMALGSSTPEILLSMIEIAGRNWYSGDLGPGTVVGSASFNLYMITAFCMVALPAGVTRKIEGTTVFLITAFHSLAAYIWMTVVLLYLTPDVVTLAEALITLGACPWLVFLAYAADRNWFRGPRQIHPDDSEIQDQPETEQAALESVIDQRPPPIKDGSLSSLTGSTHPLRTVAACRRAVAAIISVRTLGKHAQGQSSKALLTTESLREELGEWAEDAEKLYSFCSTKYAVHRDAFAASLTVFRGGESSQPSFVKYSTRNHTALAGTAFVSSEEGKVHFDKTPSVQIRRLEIPLIPADDRTGLKFRVHLHLPECSKFTLDGGIQEAEVTITDKEGPGELVWVNDDLPPVSSLQESVTLHIERRGGWDGAANVHVRTVDGTAVGGIHYEPLEGDLHFAEGEVAKAVEVRLKQFEAPGSDEPPVLRFFAALSTHADGEVEPEIKPEHEAVEVRVRWEQSPVIGLEETSWPDQFRNAFAVCEGETYATAGWGQLAMHFLSIFWKLLAACIPPPRYLGGWACFAVGLFSIGVVTMLINDLASIFGCLVGLRDQVTAITVVALGTSLPDTFASVLAIRSDDNADNAIGNITGSNSINVFLGLGLPWTVASIIWGQAGATPEWLARYSEWTRLDEYRETGAFVVIGGSLGFNTMLFTILTLVAFSLLGVRRYFLGHELGGSRLLAWLSSGLLVTLWLIYILVSSLEVYHPEMFAINLGYQRG